ncbi:signal transduction protein with HDOD/GAF domains [Nitrospira sp. KM1]|uniref:HDOD domain-containing protein n=1 Tax=Nitrospira sp. KM1 TaxID=1936990 RepID=UPI0013A727C9|nr:HDOD domain-containing protein [Nitrospira sp. KM1]BCA55187.1 signal transduction protein with HDOD/GAF domains [Nitrospira sp. KM1]
MSVFSLSEEPGLVTAVRTHVHENLKSLFDSANPCLPALEKTCQKILSLAGGLTGADELAQLVSRDPALTCKVLQVANSIAYSPHHVINSVPHAVTWLGLDTVRSIVTAAQLVEQLHDMPERQQLVGDIIGRALVVAVHANELGAAVNHSATHQLFGSAMLYTVGDLAIAYQAPTLYRSILSVSSSPLGVSRESEEIKVIGVSRRRFTQALAHIWGLPGHINQLFAADVDGLHGHWHGDRETFQGLIIGCAALVEAKMGAASRPALEEARGFLQKGTGLPSQVLGDILVRAMDRGHQLIRSAGMFWNHKEQCLEPPKPKVVMSVGHSSPSAQTVSAQPAFQKKPSPVETRPLETLQALQSCLHEAKDLNALLGALVRALHRDAGFDRVALALLNPHDTDQLVGRLLLGIDPPGPHLTSLNGSLGHDHPYFLSLLKQPGPTLIEDWGKETQNSSSFLHLWNAGSGIVAPLRIGTRPIGLIYSDCGPRPRTVVAKDYQAFQLFFSQATLSMNRLAGVL